MSEPPLDPPPFEPAMIRKCIKANVRIQNHDRLQEVLILTTVCCSVESQLNDDPNRCSDCSNENRSGSSESELSDFSDSSSEEDSEDETNGVEAGNYAQCKDPNPGHRMKAFWLRKEPMCEVCPSCEFDV